MDSLSNFLFLIKHDVLVYAIQPIALFPCKKSLFQKLSWAQYVATVSVVFSVLLGVCKTSTSFLLIYYS